MNPVKYRDWVTFNENQSPTKDFSPSFKQALAERLFPQLYKKLEGHATPEKNKFHLMIGFFDHELIESNGWMFFRTLVTNEYARGFYATICWRSEELEGKTIHQADISDHTVEFAWTTDFPLTEIVSDLNGGQIDSTTYQFPLEMRLDNFPDLSISFDFHVQPSQDGRLALVDEVKSYSENLKFTLMSYWIDEGKRITVALSYKNINHSHFDLSDMERLEHGLHTLIQSIASNPTIAGIQGVLIR